MDGRNLHYGLASYECTLLNISEPGSHLQKKTIWWKALWHKATWKIRNANLQIIYLKECKYVYLCASIQAHFTFIVWYMNHFCLLDIENKMHLHNTTYFSQNTFLSQKMSWSRTCKQSKKKDLIISQTHC